MAVSLALTAAGIIVCYLLVHVTREEGKTMNWVLVQRFASAPCQGEEVESREVERGRGRWCRKNMRVSWRCSEIVRRWRRR